MSIFELLNLVFQAGVQSSAAGVLNASINYDTGEMTLSVSIGPIEPRTRIVKLAPNNMVTATQVKTTYQEVTHGLPQPPFVTETDLTSSATVSQLIAAIWTWLKG